MSALPIRRIEPSARVIDLTPEVAKDLLDRNPRNRGISDRNLRTLARAMRNGEWELNGEAIKVDSNGVILDGQHRCMAVVESGVTIRTFLIENVPAATQDTMDTGKVRSLSDVLTIRGEAQASSLASIIRTLCMREKWGLRESLGNYGQLTVREQLAFFDASPESIRSMVHPCRKVAQSAFLPATAAAVLWQEFAEIDSEDAEFFFDRLESGVQLDATHPIYVLRSQLKGIKENVRGERNRVYMAALVIKAWNKFRDGETVRQLKFRPGGANPEKFPEPH